MRLHAIKSFYDHQNGLVTLEDDVLSIVRQVRERYGDKVSIQLDEGNGWYHFVEHGDDGTDRLIFSTEELDGRAVERLFKADSQWHGHEDPYAALEREQDEAQAELDKAHLERVLDAGERLASAIKKDGLDDRMPLQVAVTRPVGHRWRSKIA